MDGSAADVATPTVNFAYDTIYPRRTTMTDGTGVTSYTYKTIGQAGGGIIDVLSGRIDRESSHMEGISVQWCPSRGSPPIAFADER